MVLVITDAHKWVRYSGCILSVVLDMVGNNSVALLMSFLWEQKNIGEHWLKRTGKIIFIALYYMLINISKKKIADWHTSLFPIVQLTFEQHSFKLHRSSYAQILFSSKQYPMVSWIHGCWNEERGLTVSYKRIFSYMDGWCP